MKCIAWLQGTPWECRHNGECDETRIAAPADDSVGGIIGTWNDSHVPDAGNSADDSESGGSDASDEPQIRTYKDDSALRDQQSTGRKRAAKAYPLDEDADCEWQMKKNCGGGETPIVGCMNGKQQARHHGPDKNTLNNELGNVHRICHSCHNRWHTLNDDGYVWGNVYPLHNPVEATMPDIGLNEVFWDGRAVKKAKD